MTLTADLVVQLAANIASRWAIYVTLALGFGVLYRAVRVFHVSYAALIGLPPYIVAAGLQAGMTPWAAGALALAAAVAGASLLELVIYDPLERRGAGSEGGMIASLGVYGVAQSLGGAAFGYALLRAPLTSDGTWALGDAIIGKAQVLQIGIGLVAVAALFLLERSDLGVRLRAIGDNPRLMALRGAQITRLRLWASIWAASCAAAGGIAVGADTGVDPRTGMQLFLGAAVAVFLGGVDRPLGWVLAAFVLAFAENVTSFGLEAKWAPTIVYAMSLALLMLRPRGLTIIAHRVGQTHG
jgi:branched-subunit amino acid ABC-type transport system permease component